MTDTPQRSRDDKGRYATEYPANWSTYIVHRIKRRAHFTCERCGVSNGRRGWWQGRTFVECSPDRRIPPAAKSRVIRIALTVVARNYNPRDCALMDQYAPAPPLHESNLIALCQRCHKRWEAQRPKPKKKPKTNKQPSLLNFGPGGPGVAKHPQNA